MEFNINIRFKDNSSNCYQSNYIASDKYHFAFVSCDNNQTLVFNFSDIRFITVTYKINDTEFIAFQYFDIF